MHNFKEQLYLDQALFNQSLVQFMDRLQYVQPLNDAMKYSLQAGGKRLRPILMLETAKMLGIEIERVVPLMICIELIHTYSLIHDDLPAMDDDTLRRGLPTNHVKFGEAQAILAGDALLNLSVEHALSNVPEDMPLPYLHAVRLLFQSAGSAGMIGGQSIDIKSTGKFQNHKELREMHAMKTGALFHACCVCPAYLHNASNEIADALTQYAQHFGLLFQITDDILDVVGDVQKMGKTIGKDLDADKSTYVNLLGLEKSKLLAENTARNAQDSLHVFGDKGWFLREMINYIVKRDQ